LCRGVSRYAPTEGRELLAVAVEWAAGRSLSKVAGCALSCAASRAESKSLRYGANKAFRKTLRKELSFSLSFGLSKVSHF